MFGNKERDKEIERLTEAVDWLRHRMGFRLKEIGELNTRHASLVCDVADTEDAIKLILDRMGMEVITIRKHKELVPKETADTE